MKREDRVFRKMAESEIIGVPECVHNRIEAVLRSLPEDRKLRFRKPLGRMLCSAAAVLIAVFIVLPNMSESICYAMSELPGIGGIVKVVTFRKYTYEDNNYQADVDVPVLGTDAEDEELAYAAESINSEMAEMTDLLINQFEETVEKYGGDAHSAISEKYRVISDDDRWFTLEVMYWYGSGSSNTLYKYYNIDKSVGRVVNLSDLFSSDEYIKAISDEIKGQMARQMEENESTVYWLNESPKIQFELIDKNEDFYFSDSESIVIVFDKYEVGPGYMGCPAFEIPKEVYSEYLK